MTLEWFVYVDIHLPTVLPSPQNGSFRQQSPPPHTHLHLADITHIPHHRKLFRNPQPNPKWHCDTKMSPKKKTVTLVWEKDQDAYLRISEKAALIWIHILAEFREFVIYICIHFPSCLPFLALIIPPTPFSLFFKTSFLQLAPSPPLRLPPHIPERSSKWSSLDWNCVSQWPDSFSCCLSSGRWFPLLHNRCCLTFRGRGVKYHLFWFTRLVEADGFQRSTGTTRLP